MLAKLENSVQAGKSEGSVSKVSSETVTEDDIRSMANTREESKEMERIVQQEEVEVKTGDNDMDLEKLQDQFREFTEFLKWKKMRQENDLKVPVEKNKVEVNRKHF